MGPDETLTTENRERTCASLRVLIAIIDDCGEDDHELLALRQDMLDEMGGSLVALMMASCVDDELCEAGLYLRCVSNCARCTRIRLTAACVAVVVVAASARSHCSSAATATSRRR